MKIRFMSDLHTNWGYQIPICPHLDVDVEIWAGDIFEGKKFPSRVKEVVDRFPSNRKILHVLGNHEYYRQSADLLPNKMSQIDNPNYHCLNNSVVEIDGVSFIGTTLWTDFSAFGTAHLSGLQAGLGLSDFKYIRNHNHSRKWTPYDMASHFHEAKTWLFKQIEIAESKGNKVVVITHHAPSLESVAEEYKFDNLTPAYANNFDYHMMYQFGEVLWVHGHMHNSSDYVMGKTRVVCNPYGYHNDEVNPDFREDWVIEL